MKKQYATRADRLTEAARKLLNVLDQYEFQEDDVTKAIGQFRQILDTRPGQPRSDLPAQEIKQLRDDGYSLGQIASRLGCSKDTVRRRLLQCDYTQEEKK